MGKQSSRGPSNDAETETERNLQLLQNKLSPSAEDKSPEANYAEKLPAAVLMETQSGQSLKEDRIR